jgi:uncharacterized protein (DUF305 family)
MAVALAAATAVLAGAAGWWVAQPDVPGRDSVDVEFLDDMITHHQQAIALATTYRERGDDRFLRHLAGDVLLGQAAEVGRMQQLLDGWNRLDDADSGRAMAWMRAGVDGAGVPTAEMPGMASAAELERLTTLSGAALDEAFSRLLVRHHHGGLAMAEAAADRAATKAVRTLARASAHAQRGDLRDLERHGATDASPR